MEISFLMRIGPASVESRLILVEQPVHPARRLQFPTPVRGRNITRKAMRAIAWPVTSSIAFPSPAACSISHQGALQPARRYRELTSLALPSVGS
ncbi:hypothetical protein OH809_03645 [Streptomyces sp. NBC_00873]|uniref:hypothetical protein n=1 Tax=Streptomyces sp. NBC_00873 TaxID=2975852 RepID=UPI00386B65D7|nr:hypothetical protein OH809_03645 [Streptomyces sp. NBC_00873]